MRIVITGATGNTGIALLRRLQREHVEIVGIVRRLPDDAPPFAGVEWHSIDVGRPDSVARLGCAMTGADAVIHLAWHMQPSHHEPERVLARTNIDGTRNVLTAAATAGVGQVVVASSVAAYSVGPKQHSVDESWPTGGLHTSQYSRHKAMIERMLDRFQRENPGIRVSRLRPGLIFQGEAGRVLADRFFKPGLPVRLFRRVPLPVLPVPARLIVQAVHADDVADAYWRVVSQAGVGAFNVAAVTVLDSDAFAHAFRASHHVTLSRKLLRSLVYLSWNLRLHRMDPGWLDLATFGPLMSTERIRRELAWSETVSAPDALTELVQGMAHGSSVPASPQLRAGP